MTEFIVRNRWTDHPQFIADAPRHSDSSQKLRSAVMWALKNDARLSHTDLSYADLKGVDLREVDLTGACLNFADLRHADLRGTILDDVDLIGADLRGAIVIDVPKIENIHQKVAAAVQGGALLDMNDWHSGCGTAHCRAGWVVTLAGEAGLKLEEKIGTALAARQIYAHSDPEIEILPDFYCSKEIALADIMACAEREKLNSAL